MNLVYITWLDSRGVSSSWTWLEDITEPELCYCTSVGFVVKETKEFLVLAPNISDNGKQFIGHMTIPKCAITERWAIE